MLKFGSENAFPGSGNNFVSNFASRSFQCASHARKNGNFPDFLPRNTRNTRRRSEALARQARKGI
jgi:hypothetical protein